MRKRGTEFITMDSILSPHLFLSRFLFRYYSSLRERERERERERGEKEEREEMFSNTILLNKQSRIEQFQQNLHPFEKSSSFHSHSLSLSDSSSLSLSLRVLRTEGEREYQRERERERKKTLAFFSFQWKNHILETR